MHFLLVEGEMINCSTKTKYFQVSKEIKMSPQQTAFTEQTENATYFWFN
jgi:hypothetical protein